MCSWPARRIWGTGSEPGEHDCAGDETPPSIGTGHAGCLPFLCKIQPEIVQSCDVYNDGNNNISPGSINIGPSPK